MRLETIVGLVPACNTAVDVGADHAQVAIALVRSGLAKCATATDCVPGPLRRAVSAIRAAGLSDRVQTVLTDGLTGLPKHDAVIIAGMGGELILHILETADWVRDPDVTCVLQPMTAGERLREGLCTRGFSITREVIAREGRKFYPVLQVRRGDDAKIETVDELYLSAAGDTDPNASAYLTHVINRLTKQKNGLLCAEQPDTEAIEEVSRSIDALTARLDRL